MFEFIEERGHIEYKDTFLEYHIFTDDNGIKKNHITITYNGNTYPITAPVKCKDFTPETNIFDDSYEYSTGEYENMIFDFILQEKENIIGLMRYRISELEKQNEYLKEKKAFLDEIIYKILEHEGE